MTTSGPFTKTQLSTPRAPYGRYAWIKHQVWNAQNSPFRERLEYLMITRQVTVVHDSLNTPGSLNLSVDSVSFDELATDPLKVNVHNRAYSKFKDQCGFAAEIAVSLAERKQAMDSIVKRSTQLARFGRALKKLDFQAAARELGFTITGQRTRGAQVRLSLNYRRTKFNGKEATITQASRWSKRPRHPKDGDYEVTLKKNLKSFGDNYLEFHFGWEPMYKDLSDSLALAVEPTFLGLASQHTVKVSAVNRLPAIKPVLSAHAFTDVYGWISREQLIADVQVVNKNLYNLEQLGFINLASIALELVPFSFLLDWVVNLQDVVKSYTDFAGLAIIRPATTRLITCEQTYWYNFDGDYHQEVMLRTACQRTLGISGPTLSLRDVKLPSITRGLTAISLLAQTLKH